MNNPDLSYPILTIAIPTYNRNKVILENLEGFIANLPKWIHLLIVDNSSEIPVQKTLEEAVKTYPEVSLEVVRNPANIGGNSNILRCVELTKTEYIWIVGDDDYLDNGIFESIKLNLEIKRPIWINLYERQTGCQPLRKSNYRCQNLQEFLERLNSISELVFMSTNIYRTSVIKAGIAEGYHYQATMAPHLIAMLYGISKTQSNGEYHISTAIPFRTVSNNQDQNTAWPLYQAYLGIMSIPRLSFQKEITASLLRLIRGARRNWLTDKQMVIAFSRISVSLGRRIAFHKSIDFPLSIIVVDKYYSTISIPIYICAIVLGNAISIIYSRLHKQKQQCL